MQLIEFTAALALPAKAFEEAAVLRKLHDARVRFTAVSVSDVNVAIGCHRHRRWPVKEFVALTGNPGLAERHQYLALRAELNDDMALAVFAVGIGDINVAFAVERHAVRKHEHIAAKGFDDIAVTIKLENRFQFRIGTIARTAALKRPHVTRAIHLHTGGGTPGASGWIFRPTRFQAIRIILRQQRQRHQ